MQVKFDVKPEQWAHLFDTAANSGYANYWCRGMTSQRLTKTERWYAAPLQEPRTYSGWWRVRVYPQTAYVGDRCFDGHKWGWNEGDTIAAQHIVSLAAVERAFARSPGIFAAWLGDDRFDGPAAERIIQVACFGVELFS